MENSNEEVIPDTRHLCGYCERLQFKIKDICVGKDDGTFQSWATIITSASTCTLCKLILGDRVHILEPGIPLSISSVHKSDKGINNLIIKDRRGASWTTSPIYLSLLALEDSAPTKHVSGRCIKPASDLGCAKRWLSNCLHNHDHLQNPSAARPARLIAVGTDDGSQPISLINSSTTDAEYLALSHCWGKGVPFRTLKDNLEALAIEISWHKLPKTFQDAIQITRGLGVGYLWIDALCIIQDDPLDWDIESAKMSGVYNNALLTIMAASTSDSYGGCFRDHIDDDQSVLIPYTDETGATSLSISVGHAPRGYRSVIRYGPLFSRGWVFQERLISKRKLIFGEDQLYWECNDSIKTETGLLDEWEDMAEDRLYNPPFRAFSEPQLQFPGGMKIIFSLWNDAVEVYSDCFLTYETDKLPSLSGLAQIYKQRTGYTYVAGLWLEEMPQALLWHRPDKAVRHSKDQYIAPSWSWASTQGSCIFQDVYEPDDYVLEILQADIKLAGTDCHGRVSPGSSIRVKGRLREAWLERSSGSVRPSDESKQRGSTHIKGEDGELVGSASLDRHVEGLPLRVYCLEVTVQGASDFLILQRVREGEVFERLGVGVLSGFDPDAYWFSGIAKTELVLI